MNSPVKSRALLLLLVAGAAARAEPNFQLGKLAGDGESPYRIPIIFDADGSMAVARAYLDFSYDGSVLFAQEQCVASVGDPTPTHNVTCTVDELAETVSVSVVRSDFSQVLTGRHQLGTIDFQIDIPLDGETVSAYPLTIDNVDVFEPFDFPIANGPHGDGEVRVVPSWPVDEFEPDDAPIDAKATPGPGNPDQLRSFHDDDDDDWLALSEGACVLVGATLEVRPPDGEAGSTAFVPRVEIYDHRRFDLLVPPLAAFGSCATAEGPAPVSVPDGSLDENNLIRVRNCKPVPAGGLPYHLEFQVSYFCPQDATLIKGTVTELGSGQPVSLFVRTSLNSFTLSLPDSGNYAIAALADTAMTLETASSEYLAETISVPPLTAGTVSEGNDFVVRSRFVVFKNGFEPGNAAQR